MRSPFVFLMFTGLGLEGAELLRGPYLQNGTPSSVTVKWRTDEPADSLVRFGTEIDNLNRSASNEEPETDHAVTLTGLPSGQKYFYSVGSSTETLAGGDASFFFLTPPPAGTPKPTRIWAIGDCGTAAVGDFGSHIVRDAYLDYMGTNTADVWLMLGDNAYFEGWDHEYQAAVFDTYPTILRNTILWSTIGNHETYSSNAVGHFAYYDIFSLPSNGEAGGIPSGTEKYYSFDHANIHFVCLDSEHSSRATDGPMWTWLQQDLSANTNEWVIAFWHSPPYSKGSHDSDNTRDNFGNMILMRTNFVSLLESYGVDLVLSGHSHCYERSYLLNGHYGFSSSLTPQMLKDAGSGRPHNTGAYLKPAGPAGNKGAVYIVSGSSGWATVLQPTRHPAMHTTLLRRGSMIIDIHGQRLDAKFLQDDGLIPDYFTIIKGGPAEPLRFAVFRVNNGVAIARWKSIAGHTYRIERASNLENPDWNFVSSEITASGATTSWTNSIPTMENNFYRVVQTDP